MANSKYRQEINWIVRDKYHGHADLNLLEKDIKRLRAGEPSAYIIGSTPFLNCEIDLSAKPLIPRAETEYWVERAVKEINNLCNTSCPAGQEVLRSVRCLDMFAGSGCIGVAILKNVPQSKMVFVEKDKKILKQIEINLKLNKIPKGRHQIIQSDIFNSFGSPASKWKFDYILANPPYVPAGRKLPASVKKWEPKQALFGGQDGLFYIKKFLKQAGDFLKPHGEIWLEFDAGQKKTLEKLAKDLGYQNSKFYRDQYKRWRFATFQKPS